MRIGAFVALLLFAAPVRAQMLAGATVTGSVIHRDSMNFLIIIEDDLDREVHGALVTDTWNLDMPNVDAIAASGIAFPEFHTALACTPTRKGMLTSRYDYRNGERMVGSDKWAVDNESFLDAFREQMPSAFVVGVGKYGGMTGAADVSDRSGVERWLGRPGNMVQYDNSALNEQTDYDRDRVPQNLDVDVPTGTYATDQLLTDWQTILSEWRTDHAGDPLVAVLAFNAPHFGSGVTYHYPSGGAPWTSCDIVTDPGTDCRDELIAMVEEPLQGSGAIGLDAAIGSALAELTPAERAETCIIWFTDNGATGYFTVPTDRGKGTAYGGATRSGAIFSGACVPESNHGTKSLAGLHVTDLGPTLADIAGIELAAGYDHDGVSFASLLTADCGAGACDTSPRTYIYGSDTGTHVRAQYADNSYSLIVAYDASDSELYAYATDEFEATDLCAGDCSTASLTTAQDTACQALADWLEGMGAISSPLLCGGS